MSCRKERPATAEEIRLLGSKTDKMKVYSPQGCPACGNTGYLGRIGIFEFISVSKNIKPLILQQCSSDMIRDASLKDGTKTLIQNGLDKIKNGITSVEEVLRVTQVD
jgi:type IV pilus assembly protein PilB